MAKVLKGFRDLEIIDSEIIEDLLSKIDLVEAAQKALELNTERRRSASNSASISKVDNAIADLSSTLLEWGQLARPSKVLSPPQVFSNSVKQEMRILYNLAGEGLNCTDTADKYVAELTSHVNSTRQQLNLAGEDLSCTDTTVEYVAKLTSRLYSVRQQLGSGTVDSDETWVPETMDAEDENRKSLIPHTVTRFTDQP